MRAIYIGETETYRKNGKDIVQFKKNNIYQSIKRCHTEWADLTEEGFLAKMNNEYPELEESIEGYILFVDEQGTPTLFDNGYWQKVFYIL